MAMGMMSAPSTFQRLMDEVLDDVLGAKTYIDDTFVFTPELLPDVNLGLNLNNSFCVFTCQRLCQPEALRSWIIAVTLLGYAESA
jgi:hypothetical protein